MWWKNFVIGDTELTRGWREKHSFPNGEFKNALGRLHSLAQLVEHLTSVVRLIVRAQLAQLKLGAEPRRRAINQGVPSSNLGGVTKRFRFPYNAGGCNVVNQFKTLEESL